MSNEDENTVFCQHVRPGAHRDNGRLLDKCVCDTRARFIYNTIHEVGKRWRVLCQMCNTSTTWVASADDAMIQWNIEQRKARDYDAIK